MNNDFVCLTRCERVGGDEGRLVVCYVGVGLGHAGLTAGHSL